MKHLLQRTISHTTAALVASVLLAVAPLSPLLQRAAALSGADFQAGRIIDNSIFFNSNTMTVDQIQTFLNTQVPSCDTNGTKIYSGSTTRAQYGQSRGFPAPYTCLKDYRENPSTGADNYGGKPTPDGAQSAAQIILTAAQNNTINPQVLLVIMQRESSLITDDWPWTSQYNQAMGYACPDTSGCDPNYSGFALQVNNAASQLRNYALNPNAFNFLPGANNNIQWNPNSSCGSGTVYIQDQATASLYDYTPYQPNSAALNNLYGTGDSCSAYGNRNFWRFFNEWFGSPYAADRGTDTTYMQHSIQTLEFKNQIYVFYYDGLQQVLRMATQDPTNGWQFTVLDGLGGSNSRISANVGMSLSAVVYNNYLHLFYFDKTNGNLRHAWSADGATWQFENLDGDRGSVGGRDAVLGANPSVAVFGSSIQVIYYDKTNGNLRHAWAGIGIGWQFENLDGDRGSVSGVEGDIGGYTASVAYGDSLQLFYYDQTNRALKHAWTTTTAGWKFENLDGTKTSSAHYAYGVGISPSVTAYGDSLQLFYYDEDHSDLRHAWTSPVSGWQFEDLDGDYNISLSKQPSDAGLTSTVMVNGNALNLFYYDRTSGNFRQATTSPSHSWSFINLDGDPGSLGGQNGDTGYEGGSTYFQGSTQVYYYNRTTGRLRHSWNDGTGWRFEDLGPTVIY